MESDPEITKENLPEVWKVEKARIESKGEEAVIERVTMKDGSWHDNKDPDIKGVFAERHETGITFYEIDQNDELFKRYKDRQPEPWGWGVKLSTKPNSSDAELTYYFLRSR